MNQRLTAGALGAAVIVAIMLPGSTPCAADAVRSLRGADSPVVTTAPPQIPAQKIQEGSFGRAWEQQPPLIPHRMDKYEIDLKVNQCLRCHDRPYHEEARATRISDSHYRDREGRETERVSRARWFCTQCHVPQSDIEPTVDNTFGGASD